MVIRLNTFLIFSSYYSTSDPITGIVGLCFIILIGIFCCSSLKSDDQSSKNTYTPGTFSSNRSYDEDELNYNWDDSWDDKWLHQGEYADVVVDTPSDDSTDSDIPCDDEFME